MLYVCDPAVSAHASQYPVGMPARANKGPGPRPKMRSQALRKRCLSFEGSEETFPFGPETSVFKVAGKIFALSRLHAQPLSVSLKCEPLLAEQLRAAHPAIGAGYHLNKRHWNTIVIDGSLPSSMIVDMIEDSYDLVVSSLPRARQIALGWGPIKRYRLAVSENR
jgi:predicted DNA-binding protein (MmcQ/YjbR family)